MDYNKITVLIERYRPLTGLSSLPFLTYGSKGEELSWFNYNVSQTGDDLEFTIGPIYSYVKNTGETVEQKVTLRISVTLQECSEPCVSEQEYFERLKTLNETNSWGLQLDLICQAEMSPMIPAYKEVLKYKKMI